VIVFSNFFKVEYHLLHRSRRIHNLPPVTFEPPPPPRRRKINAAGSFEPNDSIDFIGEPIPKENIASAPETTRVEDLQAKGFVRPFNPPLTGVNTPVVVQIPNPEERADTSYHISRGLVMDDLAPLVEEIQTPVDAISTPPYQSATIPSPTIPVTASTSSLMFGSGLKQIPSGAFSAPFGLGTSTTGMLSMGLFSSTPAIVNPSTESVGSSITFQVLPWNKNQVPPPIPTFGTGSAQLSGLTVGFNIVPSPQVQTGGGMSSAASAASIPFSLFASGSSGAIPPVGSLTGGQYSQTHFNQAQGNAYGNYTTQSQWNPYWGTNPMHTWIGGNYQQASGGSGGGFTPKGPPPIYGSGGGGNPP